MKHIIRKGVVTRRGFLAGGTLLGLSALLGRSFGVAQGAAKAVWNPALELTVTFTTAESSTGRYERPYVAVWIENASGTPIRTLGLWMLNSSRGLRYLEHLTRWYNAAQSNSALTNTQTNPTRVAGSYQVVWDGRDDKKALLPQGDYVLCIESARQEGPYSLLQQPISIGSTLFTKKLASSGELTNVSAELRKLA